MNHAQFLPFSMEGTFSLLVMQIPAHVIMRELLPISSSSLPEQKTMNLRMAMGLQFLAGNGKKAQRIIEFAFLA